MDYITTHKLGSCDLTSCKDESANAPLFNGHEEVSSTSDKAKLFAGIFSENVMTQVYLYLLSLLGLF